MSANMKFGIWLQLSVKTMKKADEESIVLHACVLHVSYKADDGASIHIKECNLKSGL